MAPSDAYPNTARGSDAEASRWLLKYGDRIYGPYTLEAMRGYIAEGRVIAQSVVAPEGTLPGADAWRNASHYPDFAGFFGATQSEPAIETPTPVAAPAPQPMPRQREPEAEADDRTQGRSAYGSAKGQTDRRRQPETANFLVIMDIKARYAGALEQAIMSLGPAYKLAPNVWCVNTNGTATGLLNDLSIHIGKTDSMFIVDATRDRTAWLNLGPETDAKLRRVWRRPF
ncbi:hypothetical protein [Parvibaculum sp.]|uniref:hypothetical protein n=1 Tax=Parvibaculum sp. TaxID=2024848 RepID=UPI002C8BDA5C|nr:hypothetical protein [Parvibaculum sp.]HUD50980.1 hypothetical protein [Parvibaculum sp.]